MQHTHIRFLDPRNGAIDNRSGATVAWKADGDKIQIAVSTCSDADNFSRKEGTKRATERLEAGDVIVVRATDLAEAMMTSAGTTRGEAIVRAAMYLKRIEKAEVRSAQYTEVVEERKVITEESRSVQAMNHLRRYFGIE